MSKSKKLYLSEIKDQNTQQNFKAIAEIIGSTPFTKGEWTFREFTIPVTGSNLKIAHNLNYTPADVILTSQIGGTITFNYSLFDATFLDVTATVTSSPLIIRAIIGKYTEGSVYV